jgi:hypothetical protein
VNTQATLNLDSKPRLVGLWVALSCMYATAALMLSVIGRSYSIAVVMFGALAVVASFRACWRWPWAVAVAIVVLVPFQPLPTLVTQGAGLSAGSVASAMKEVLMAVAIVAAGSRFRPKLAAVDVLLIVLLGIALLLRLFGGTWIGIKDDLEFVLPFAAGRVIQLSPMRQSIWVKLSLLSMSIVAFLGFLEYMFVPPELRALWMAMEQIPTQFYATGYGRYRISSTLAGPAEFGAMCAFALVLFFAFRHRLSRWWWSAVPLLVTGVFLSVTRSVWIAAMLGIGVVEIKRGRSVRVGLLLAATVVCLIVAAPLLGVADFFSATVTRQDSSLEGHVESIVTYSAALFEHPLGTGPGTVGPRAVERSSRAVNPESSYLALTLEYGLIGGLVFILFCIICLWHTWRSTSDLGIAASGIALGYIACMFVMPYHMSFSMGSWVWFPTAMVITEALQQQSRTRQLHSGLFS